MAARLNIGPFGESIEAIEKFGTNVYMNYLYGQTIEQLLEAEREFVSLATKNYQNSQDDVSASDKTK